MIRKTLAIFSLLGLLLSVVAWGASYYRVKYWSSTYDITFSMGCCEYLDKPTPMEPNWLGWRRLDFTGFGTIWWPPDLHRGQAYPQGWYMIMPLWIPVLCFGVPSWFLFFRPIRRRRKRKKLGLCLECGYNLRGLTELRCPECNTPFEKCSAKP